MSNNNSHTELPNASPSSGGNGARARATVAAAVRSARASVYASKTAIETAIKKPSVFGAAPCLTQMIKINSAANNKKVMFRWPTFWYYFRIYYHLAIILFVTASLHMVRGFLLVGFWRLVRLYH